MTVEKIQVPDLGDTEDAEVIEILVSVGDEISENDSLIVLETDKAAMEIPAPKTGVVKEILVKVGDQLSQGGDILVIDTGAGGGVSEETAKESTESSSQISEEEEAEEKIQEQVEPAPIAAATQASESTTTSKTVEIKIPDLGDDGDVEVIEILVAEGDEIQQEDGLITLETDKAAMDVPAPMAGTVESIKIKVGDTVSKGTLILLLATTSTNTVSDTESSDKAESVKVATTASSASSVSSPEPEPTPQSTPVQAVNNNAEVYAGPAVRKLARELGVDLSQVSGSGIKNRIVKEDVHEFVKGRLQGGGASAGSIGLPTMKDIDFSKFGETEEVSMSKLHKLTAQNMANNWVTIPHVTQFEEVDVTELEDFRASQKSLSEQKGIKLTPLPFIIKACAQALVEYPQFNISLHSSGDKYIQKKYINIGIAVATPAGLMVPVIKNVDQKSIWQLAAEVAELGAKAQDRKLSKEDMEGGCFTISSLGNLGGMGFTPIVNAPEVAILGVSKTSVKPVYVNEELLPRKMMPYSLSYDHRAVNGLDGGLFCTYLSNLLNDIRLMVL